MHTAWVEVDLGAIRHNYRQVKAYAGEGVAVMAVIKANAYGHGLELVAQGLRDVADWFGVSTVEEGIRARAAAPESRILVFHPVNAWNAGALVAHRLTATVDSEAGAAALAEAGRAAGMTPEAHLKIDTGMSRFGVPVSGTEADLRLLDAPGIVWDGLYTHMATMAGGRPALRRLQAMRYQAAITIARERPAPPPTIHIWNSAGALAFREHQDIPFTLVRCGTILYGQYPSPRSARPLDLKPTWAFRTRITSLREVQRGTMAGYGAEWEARRDSRIATIPVGYADGFTMEPRSAWKRQGGLRGLYRKVRRRDAVTVITPHGRAQVVGRVASQSAMLDVTDLPDARVGDIVEVPARRVVVGEHVPRLARPPGDGEAQRAR